MRAFALALMIAAMVAPAFADEPDDMARSILLLAKAKRERQQSAVVDSYQQNPYTSDIGQARALAKLRQVPLFVWVKEGCHAGIRAKFPNAVHCHVPTWDGDGSARLILPLGKWDWSIPKELLTDAYATEIQRALKGEDITKPKAEIAPAPRQTYIPAAVYAPVSLRNC